jgi:hypothetical protein
VQKERDVIRRALASAPNETRRNALAAMLAHYGLYAEAIGTLAPEMFAPQTVAAGDSYAAFRDVLPRLSESSRVLLYNAFMATNQQQWARLIHTEPGTPKAE